MNNNSLCYRYPWECRWTTEVVGYEEQQREVTVCETHGEQF